VIAGLGVSREQVEGVMRLVLGSTTARLSNWQVEQLPYLSVLPGRALARLAGSAALETGESTRWSAVVKVITPARDREGSSVPDSGYREVLAYRSGLLTDLPGRFRAPRVYAIDDAEGGRIWLWLEDLRDVYDRSWPLQQFRTAAHDLGVFNGHYLVSGPPPAEPWLNQWLRYAWAEEHAEIQRIPSYRRDLDRALNMPEVRRQFGPQVVARITQLLEDQSTFMRWLSRLPETLCHHDTALANLFAMRGPKGLMETVAVDWEKIGPGPIGAEIATLTFGTLRRCEFDGARTDELDAAVFAGYINGLHEAGWQGPVELVRLGYTAAIALRWTVLAGILHMLAHGAAPVRTSQGVLVPSEAVLVQRVRLAQFLLDRADEARRLGARWSGSYDA
jgi:hypothetical protein